MKSLQNRAPIVDAKNPIQYERTEKKTDTISMLYNKIHEFDYTFDVLIATSFAKIDRNTISRHHFRHKLLLNI